MVKFSVEVTVDPLPSGIDDIEKIIREETFKAAIRLMNKWISNIEGGTGSGGSHGGPYVNTGESASSIQIDPERQGAEEYTIFSDKIQTLIAEVGRAPGSTPPPFAPISQWVHEKLGIRQGSPDHYGVVRAIQLSIGKNGIDPFMPMEKAVIDVVADLEQRMGAAMDGK